MAILPARLLVLSAVLASAIAVRAEEPNDALGDPLPKGAKSRLGTARGIASDRREIMALPPDYRTFASIERDKEVVIWDMETGRVTNRLIPENPAQVHLRLVTVSADGKRLVTWESGFASVWDIPSRRQILTFKTSLSVPEWHSHSLFSLSRDGKLLAIGGWPEPLRKEDDGKPIDPDILVWDVEKNALVARIPGRPGCVHVPVLSQDGKTLASCSIEMTAWVAPARKPGEPVLAPPPRPSPDPVKAIRLWDVTTEKEISQARMSQRQPISVVLSPDGRTLAVIVKDGLIERWDTQTGERKPPLQASDLRWHRIAFAPDGRTLAAVAARGIVRRWSNADARLLGETDVPHITIAEPGFVDNERLVVWGNNGFSGVAWEIPSGKLLTPNRDLGVVKGIGFRNGGNEIVVSDHDSRVVRFDAMTGKPLGFFLAEVKRPPDGFTSESPGGVVVSPDATRVVSGRYHLFARPPFVFDPIMGAELFAFPPTPKGNKVEYLMTADLSRVVLLSEVADLKRKSVTCEVWDVDSRKNVKEFTLPIFNEFEDRLINPHGILTGQQRAALSPDGSRLVTVGAKKVPPRKPGQPLTQPTALVTGWDLKTGKQLAVLEFPNNHTLRTTLAVASNRAVIYQTFNGPLRVLDYDRGEVLFELDNLRQEAISFAPVFSPDGTTCAAGIVLKDKTFGVRLYDWQKGRILHTFEGHVAPITALAFSPDGRTLASGSQDTTVLLWDLSVISK